MKIRNFIISVIFLGLGLMFPFGNQAEAVSNLASCPDDYYSFIRTARSEYTRNDYFTDFFKRSFCQVSDIILLNDQLEEIRDKFRSAAFECRDTSAFKTEYLRILMETHFVRNVQDVSQDFLEDFEIEDLEERRELTLEKLRKDMIEIFVVIEQQVDEETFNGYFDGWAQKYENKVADYRACNEGPWAEVNETWTDFLETVSGIDIEVEKKKFQFPRIGLETEKDIDTRDWSRVKTSMQSFFRKFKKQEEDKVEDPISVDEAAKQARSISKTFELLESSELVFDIEIESAQRMAKYKLLYGEGGARPSSDLQKQVQGINEIIEETNSTDFPNIINSVAKVSDKQCT